MKLFYRLSILFFVMSAKSAAAFSVDTLYICKNRCIGYTNVTTVGTAVAWAWTFEGGTPGTSNLQNPSTTICYPNAGIFRTTIKTTFDTGSDTTDSVVVVVYDHPIPAFSFPKDTGYCQGGSFPLQLTTVSYPGVRYQWSTGATGPSITVNTQGRYWVNLVLKVGSDVCDSVYREVNITEYANPQVNLGPDRLMCQNQLIALDAGPGAGYQYLWQPGNEVTRNLNVSLPGTYSVRVTTPNGCQASDQIEFKDSCPHYIFVPNAVSPNEDRLNDLFVKVWNFTPQDYLFAIYNRWGELLFETTDMNAGWDCKVNSALVPQDIYVYKITYFDNDKQWYEMRGTFYVVR